MFKHILKRPALAIVLAIIVVFLGGLGVKSLPVAQFPSVAPPTVYVSIAYPGASADVLVDSVLIPLEQSINGVQDMRYIVSDATSAGEATIRIYFEPGTDPSINVVNVQNRINIVLSRLPPLVVREGILVSQVVPSMLMYLNLYSTDPDADQTELFNYANVYVMPRLKRIRGMGIPRNLGNRNFAMRIWLNPERMRAYHISVEDVMEAVEQQSLIGSPGRRRPGEPIKLCCSTASMTSSTEMWYARIRSGLSQMRIAKLRFPRFLGMPIPRIRFNRGIT